MSCILVVSFATRNRRRNLQQLTRIATRLHLDIRCSVALIITSASDNEAHALDIYSLAGYKLELVTEEWKMGSVVLLPRNQAFLSPSVVRFCG